MNEKQGYPERIVPDEVAPGIVAIHLKRYAFALNYIKGLHVLDIACGVGYGTAYLAEVATKVVGVDIDPIAIEYANKHYNKFDHIEFFCGDAAQLQFDDHSFDVVCSFETIEHVPDVDRFLTEVVRVIKQNGQFIVSTPAAKNTTKKPSNPHHVQEWSPPEFSSLLYRYFNQVKFFSQMPRTTGSASLIRTLDVFKLRALLPLSFRRLVAGGIGVHTTDDLNLDDVLIVEGLQLNASEIVAVCKVNKDIKNANK